MAAESLPNGAYTNETSLTNDWWWDAGLAEELARLFEGGSVGDFGCGIGRYSEYLAAGGLSVQGFDAIPEIEQFTAGRVRHFDLTVPQPTGDLFDWVLCLEVLEHIPAEFEATALDNLDARNRRGIVLSWAVPGQDGIGHVNERPNDHAIETMTRRGYRHDVATQERLRRAARRWFVNTLLVFRR